MNMENCHLQMSAAFLQKHSRLQGTYSLWHTGKTKVTALSAFVLLKFTLKFPVLVLGIGQNHSQGCSKHSPHLSSPSMQTAGMTHTGQKRDSSLMDRKQMCPSSGYLEKKLWIDKFMAQQSATGSNICCVLFFQGIFFKDFFIYLVTNSEGIFSYPYF